MLDLRLGLVRSREQVTCMEGRRLMNGRMLGLGLRGLGV